MTLHYRVEKIWVNGSRDAGEEFETRNSTGESSENKTIGPEYRVSLIFRGGILVPKSSGFQRFLPKYSSFQQFLCSKNPARD